MAHTYAANFVHCVFSTKGRVRVIAGDKQQKLWAYLFGISKNIGIELLAIGGTADHVHLLLAVPPDRRLAEAIRDLKANSSRWMNETAAGFSWQKGYGAFSVSPSQIPVMKEHIRNQAEHHKRRNFEEEFRALLKKSGVDYDPRHVFG